MNAKILISATAPAVTGILIGESSSFLVFKTVDIGRKTKGGEIFRQLAVAESLR